MRESIASGAPPPPSTKWLKRPLPILDLDVAVEFAMTLGPVREVMRLASDEAEKPRVEGVR